MQVFTIFPWSGQCVHISEETRSAEKPPFRILQLSLQDHESFSSGYAVNRAKKMSPASKVPKNYAICLKFKKQRVYSFLQSRHLREKVSFFILLPSRSLKMFKCIAKKKNLIAAL